MKDYIEFRVYIRDDKSPDVDGMSRDLVLKIAEDLHDTIHDYVGDNVVAHAGTFVDISDVLVSGNVTYEIHLKD